MDDIYAFLYDGYALPQLKDLESSQDRVLDELSQRLSLSRKQRLRMLDMADSIRQQWGTEVFVLGLRFGIALSAPREPAPDCPGLADLLPQLDQPVP